MLIIETDFDGYQPYQPPYWGPLRDLTGAQARESFEQLMAARPARREQLAGLLERNGGRLGETDEDVQALDDWLHPRVEQSQDDANQLRNFWHAVLADAALHLGDVIIGRAPGLRWDLFRWGKRNLYFQQPVLMGFSQVTDPKYAMEPRRLLVGHALRVTDDRQTEPEQLVTMIRHAVSTA